MLAADPQSPVDAVLAQYAEALRTGKKSMCSELLQQHPEFAAELTAFSADFERVEQHLAPWRRFSSGSPESAANLATIGPGDTAVSLPQVGEQFGDYELLAELARGGMGVVYRARQRSLNRVVALKMVLGSPADGSLGRDRFLMEARAVARLSHPNIVPIYEVGEQNGQPYFTMELFAGGSLRDRLEQVQRDPRGVAQLLATVARAVEHAHRRGILHRDLKPTNVLLDERGEPHVADFGLAKQLGVDSDLTQAGAIVGTPSYMAPEQARADTDLSTAVDVYGLGAMLYELLTGRPPFKASTPMETMMAVLGEEPPRPRQLRRDLPADLETICLKALAKVPQERYSSAAVLADDLERWLRGEPIQARRAGWLERSAKWCQRQPLLAGALGSVALAVLSLLVLGGFLWQNAEERAKAVQNLGEAEERLKDIDGERKQAEHEKQRAAQLAQQQQKRADEQQSLADRIAADVRQLEKQARDAAKRLAHAEAEARRTTYAADMQLAQVAWQTDNVPVASELLNRYRHPAAHEDVRGLEWHYLYRQLHTAKLSWRASPDPKAFAALLGLTLAPDGKTAATALVDGKVSLWSLADGKQLRTFDARKANLQGLAWGNVTGAFFEEQGRRLVLVLRKDFDTKQLDAKVRIAVANKATFKMDALRESLDYQVFDLDNPGKPRIEPFDPARLATNVFATFSGGLILVHEGNMLVVSSLERSPDGRYVAVVGIEMKAGGGVNMPGAITGGRIIIWDLQEKRIHAQQASPVAITAVAFAPVGGGLAVATSDGAVGLGKLDLAQPPRVLTGHQGPVYSLQFSQDGKQLLSGGMSGVVMLWDVATARELDRYRGHVNAVSRLALREQTLVSTGMDGTIKVWDLAFRQGPRVLSSHGQPILTLAFPDNGQEVVSTDMGGTLSTWRLADGKLLGSVQPQKVTSLNVTLSRSGRLLAWKQEFLGPVVLVRDLASGKETRLSADKRLPFVLTFSPDEAWLAASDLDKTATMEKAGLVVWKLADGKVAATLDNIKGLVNGLTFSADRKLLAAGHQNGLLLWDWQTGNTRHLLKAEQGHTVTAVAFSADSKQLAAAVEEAGPEGKTVTIRLWDVASGQVRSQCRGAGQRVTLLAFSPNGQRLAAVGVTSAQVGQLKLWDTTGGREVFTAPLPTALISAIGFSPDGQRLLAAVNRRDPIAALSGRTMPSDLYIWDGTPLTDGR